jgi:desulfoferrodoxin (superoxide reductase-like protein)
MRKFRTGVAVCLGVLLLLAAGAASAHAPSAIGLHWETGKRVLEVRVLHPVADVTAHYISRISVMAGNKVIAARTYTMQTNEKSQIDVFYLRPLRRGEKITVVAKCNRKGSMTASMIIGRPHRR